MKITIEFNEDILHDLILDAAASDDRMVDDSKFNSLVKKKTFKLTVAKIIEQVINCETMTAFSDEDVVWSIYDKVSNMDMFKEFDADEPIRRIW